MSLEFVIDGYNVARHSAFNPPKRHKDEKSTLIDYIRQNRLCGSHKNKITVVFDGFPDGCCLSKGYANIEVVFSREESADDKIKGMLEEAANPKNIAVVSDDKEVQFFIKACGAKCIGVEEFLGRLKVTNPQDKDRNAGSGLIKAELTPQQILKINQELKDIWLKQT